MACVKLSDLAKYLEFNANTYLLDLFVRHVLLTGKLDISTSLFLLWKTYL